MLPFAIAAITGALLFYSVGVWGEKLSGILRPWHLSMFWVGFLCDMTGTTLMGRLAGAGFTVSFHSVTGAAAILLMAIHAVWATVTLLRGDERSKRRFHKLSLVVWALWLIPYLSGLVYGMAH